MGCPRGPKAGKGLDGCARARPVCRRPGLRGEGRSFIGACCVVVAARCSIKMVGRCCGWLTALLGFLRRSDRASAARRQGPRGAGRAQCVYGFRALLARLCRPFVDFM